MGKKPINQSLQKELSWYLSALKYLQEGLRWFIGPQADERMKAKIADWLIPNVFSIVGA